MKEKEVLRAIIQAYRELIRQRYQPDRLAKEYHLPEAFDEEKINRFRDFFLEHIYPPPHEREALEDAFRHLDQHVKNPEKLMRLLIDSGALLFKYGRHLPKILKTGLKALKSFRMATALEDGLIEAAKKHQMSPPFSTDDIKFLLQSLPPDSLEQFIQNNQNLLETLYDRKLMKKIREIIEYLAAKMEKRPDVYTPEEVKALLIGRDLISEGDALFDELSPKEQRDVLESAIRIERDFLNNLFAQKQSQNT
ncbi:MAG: hypothetical protein D6714_21595 [Bacteroidetes bacterium]|nr:MAG: hypothetical protein D6714_21595 [Bacteroidota bacterium]